MTAAPAPNHSPCLPPLPAAVDGQKDKTIAPWDQYEPPMGNAGLRNHEAAAMRP